MKFLLFWHKNLHLVLHETLFSPGIGAQTYDIVHYIVYKASRTRVCKHCQFVFVSQYFQSCQSLDFSSLLCLHMPSTASAHAQ